MGKPKSFTTEGTKYHGGKAKANLYRGFARRIADRKIKTLPRINTDQTDLENCQNCQQCQKLSIGKWEAISLQTAKQQITKQFRRFLAIMAILAIP
jgi:hypothetical protein